MTPKITFVAAVAAALALAAPAWSDPWGADQRTATARVSPDLADRAAAARQDELIRVLDTRERSFAAKREAQLATGARDPVRDDHWLLDPSSTTTLAARAGSAGDIEWPQVGIGFGVGVLLVVGLLLAVRVARLRQPAH
jgi:hypothetical protein